MSFDLFSDSQQDELPPQIIAPTPKYRLTLFPKHLSLQLDLSDEALLKYDRDTFKRKSIMKFKANVLANRTRKHNQQSQQQHQSHLLHQLHNKNESSCLLELETQQISTQQPKTITTTTTTNAAAVESTTTFLPCSPIPITHTTPTLTNQNSILILDPKKNIHDQNSQTDEGEIEPETFVPQRHYQESTADNSMDDEQGQKLKSADEGDQFNELELVDHEPMSMLSNFNVGFSKKPPSQQSQQSQSNSIPIPSIHPTVQRP